MKALFILTIVLGIYIPSHSQLIDNFSDNEFISNPEWAGNTNNFIVEDKTLRLNAPAVTGSSYLATPSDISLEAEWNFFIKLDFNPSSSNYIKVYLMADSANLDNSKNGYFIKIGGTSDEVSLYKIVDGSESLIIDGVDDRVDLGSVELNISVTRATNGDWEVKSKLSFESEYVLEEIVNDLEIKKSSYFGLFCKYTSTRSTKFYVDDIAVIGNPYIDPEPPILVSTSTPSSRQIKLAFNEALDSLEALILSHYTLNDSISPTSVIYIKANTVLLNFSTELALINTLKINALPDMVGNNLDTIAQVLFVDPAPYTYRDLVLNEIFPDPNPQEDLPAFEFIELFNNSDRVIDLEGWQFTDDSKIATFERQLLFPDSFLIICSEEAVAAYQVYGTTTGLSNWPALNNGGDDLTLTDKSGIIIDSLSYAINWYNDTNKDNGGWSLEQVNPYSKCLGIYNWSASSSLTGGTPGKTNAVYSVNTDLESPYITQALATDSIVELWFSEPVRPNSYTSTILDTDERAIFAINTPSKYSATVISSNLEITNNYIIEIPLEDCFANKGLAYLTLIHIDAPNKGDIVINEILFDPYSGGSDFVEVLNTTDSYYNLKNYVLTNSKTSHTISDTTLLLKPRNYMAFSDAILFLKNQYLAPDSSLIKTSLPTMPNDEGHILIKSNFNKSIDSVFYSDAYHFSLIADIEGISLERISAQEDSNNKDNWKSAAETTGYATPGYENSQSSEPNTEGKITVSPEVITPNNDGQADYCQVSFSLDNSSHTISINVYNLNGQLVKSVTNNAVIAPNGFFTWDGTNQQGGALPTAHYIIVSNIISSDGRTQRFKNKVVVANGF